MNDSEIIEKARSLLGEKALEITNPAVRRIFMRVESAHLLGAVKVLKESLGFAYVATISGVDLGESFEILYHFANEYTQLNVRTQIPKSNPHVESVCPVIPGAIFYERELQDMFGLVIDHIPDPRPLIVPDDWPAGNYPLCKNWKFERPPEKIPGGKS
jgi:NADH:ubiquinone oxidoreductase subunit C